MEGWKNDELSVTPEDLEHQIEITDDVRTEVSYLKEVYEDDGEDEDILYAGISEQSILPPRPGSVESTDSSLRAPTPTLPRPSTANPGLKSSLRPQSGRELGNHPQLDILRPASATPIRNVGFLVHSPGRKGSSDSKQDNGSQDSEANSELRSSGGGGWGSGLGAVRDRAAGGLSGLPEMDDVMSEDESPSLRERRTGDTLQDSPCSSSGSDVIKAWNDREHKYTQPRQRCTYQQPDQPSQPKMKRSFSANPPSSSKGTKDGPPSPRPRSHTHFRSTREAEASTATRKTISGAVTEGPGGVGGGGGGSMQQETPPPPARRTFRPRSSRPERPSRLSSAQSTRSIASTSNITTIDNQGNKWRKWMAVTTARPLSAMCAAYTISTASVPQGNPEILEDSEERLKEVVEELRHTFNKVDEEARSKEATLRALKIELGHLENQVPDNSDPMARMIAINNRIAQVEEDHREVKSTTLIYEHMVKRIKQECLYAQSDLATLRQEVDTAAKVQGRMVKKACQVRDMHIVAAEELESQRGIAELVQEEWSESLDALIDVSEKEKKAYSAFTEWKQGLKQVVQQVARAGVARVARRVEGKMQKELALKTATMGSRHDAEKMQKAYNYLIRITGVNTLDEVVAYFVEKNSQGERITEQKSECEFKLRTIKMKHRALEAELNNSKFIIGGTLKLEMAKHDEMEEKLRKAEQMQKDAHSECVRMNRLLVQILQGFDQLNVKIECVEDSDELFHNQVCKALRERVNKASLRWEEIDHPSILDDGITKTQGRLIVEATRILQLKLEQLCNLAQKSPSDKWRIRSKLMLMRLAKTKKAGSPKASSPQGGSPKFQGGRRSVGPVMFGSDKLEDQTNPLANYIKSQSGAMENVRVDPLEEKRDIRAGEVAQWFVDHRSLIADIFHKQGTPKSGYVNIRWLAAFCSSLKFKATEEELHNNFEAKLVIAPGQIGRSKLHVSELIREPREEADEEEQDGSQLMGQGAVLSRRDLKDRELKIVRNKVGVQKAPIVKPK